MCGDDLEITVAGVPKSKGSAILKADGGILRFDKNYVFKGAGHDPVPWYNKAKGEWETITGTGKTGATYDDDINTWVELNGHRIHITRCVTIIEMDYAMSWTKSYQYISDTLEAELDKIRYSDYNKKW